MNEFKNAINRGKYVQWLVRGWIDVNQKLPEDETKCFVKYRNGQEHEAIFWNKNVGFDPVRLHLTHWKPKPK